MSNEENKAPEQNAGTVEQPAKPVEKAHYEVNPKRPVFKAATDEQKKRVDWIGLAPHHPKSDDALVEAWKPIDQDDQPHARDWAAAVDDAQFTATHHDYPYARANAYGNFAQSFKYTKLSGEVASIGIAPRDGAMSRMQGKTKLTGKSFLNVVRRQRGSDGTELMFPLPHTGVWVAVKPAKDLRWLAFDTERAERRVSVGRDTNGLMLSARSGYEQQDVLDFVIEHITDINVAGYSPENLLQHIDSLDIPILVWGFCAAQYVKGHPVRIPCMVDPSKCSYVAEIWAMISNMGWLDRDKFTPEQLEFISDYRAQRTPEELAKYRESRRKTMNEIFTLSDGTRITLSVPTAAHSLFAARRWVEDVTSAIDNSLTKSGRGKNVAEHRRFTYLMRGMEQTQLREYIPWITKIESPIGTGAELGEEITAWTDELSDIELWCEEVSSDAVITKELYEVVKLFMSDRTAAIIGYPAMKCPKCQGGYDIGDEHYMTHEVETIIPLDPIKCFLVLMARRLENTQMLHPLNTTVS